MPADDAYSSGHLALLTFGLEYGLALRPTSPELVLFPDFLSFEHPSVLLFLPICYVLFTGH